MTEDEEIEARDFFRRNSSMLERPAISRKTFNYWAAPVNVRNLLLLEELGLVVCYRDPDNVRVRCTLTSLGKAYRKVLDWQ